MCAVSILGEEDCSETWQIVLTDGAGMFYCSSVNACTLPKHNIAFLNRDRLERTDTCGRHPLEHEILHLQYPDLSEKLHDKCYIRLDNKILKEKQNEIIQYLPYSMKQKLVKPIQKNIIRI